MEEQDNPNYDSIILKLQEQDKKIAELEKKNAEIIAMNNALLTTSESPKAMVSKESERKDLEERLMKGLK